MSWYRFVFLKDCVLFHLVLVCFCCEVCVSHQSDCVGNQHCVHYSSWHNAGHDNPQLYLISGGKKKMKTQKILIQWLENGGKMRLIHWFVVWTQVNFLLVGESEEPYDIAVICESARKTPKEYFSPTVAFCKTSIVLINTCNTGTDLTTLFSELKYLPEASIMK